jgi:uncharacterized protein DUF4055
MPVNSSHSKYDQFVTQWKKCRDVVTGEVAVKAMGETYLPKLSEMEPGEYEAFKARAMFYGAAERTVMGLSGAVFRKPPTLDFPDAILDKLDTIGQEGEPYIALTKEALEEVLIAGRVGLYVDAAVDEGADPFVSIYYAENVVNWRTRLRDGRKVLELVVLKECVDTPDEKDPFKLKPIDQYRVLRLTPENLYVVELWQKQSVESQAQSGANSTTWILKETITPKRIGGNAWDEIPFTFITPCGTDTDVEKSPILDLVGVNLNHYRSSADLEHGRHFTALPTAWVAGFDPTTTKLRIGSSIAWVSGDPQARAGFLEFTGAGLGHLSEGLKHKEEIMAILGARLLEIQKRQAETAEAIQLRQSGEGATLLNIAISVGQGMTKVLKWVAAWYGNAEVDSINLLLNQEFSVLTLDSATLATLMSMVQSNLLSYEMFFDNLKRGEIVPDDRDLEDEEAAIQAGPPVAPLSAVTDQGLPGTPPSGQDPGKSPANALPGDPGKPANPQTKAPIPPAGK